jgi:hypothetical protein
MLVLASGRAFFLPLLPLLPNVVPSRTAPRAAPPTRCRCPLLKSPHALLKKLKRKLLKLPEDRDRDKSTRQPASQRATAGARVRHA